MTLIVFDSNMVFISVHHFDFTYFVLLSLAFGRAFLRESKLPNDVFFYLTSKDGNALELAELQCTRIRRARQNIMLEVCSSLLLPFLFAIDSATGWDIIVRKQDAFESVFFVFQSSMVLLSTRFLAGSCSWMYLKYRAHQILQRVHQRMHERVSPSPEQKPSPPPPPSSHHHHVHAQRAPQPVAYHYDMLEPRGFQSGLKLYWSTHLLYISVCVMYGIFNAIIFIGKINGELDAKLKL